jgi:hypothetical protein
MIMSANETFNGTNNLSKENFNATQGNNLGHLPSLIDAMTNSVLNEKNNFI